MIWRAAFVALLITVLSVACTPKYRVDCEEAPRVKNKSLGLADLGQDRDPQLEARSC